MRNLFNCCPAPFPLWPNATGYSIWKSLAAPQLGYEALASLVIDTWILKGKPRNLSTHFWSLWKSSRKSNEIIMIYKKNKKQQHIDRWHANLNRIRTFCLKMGGTLEVLSWWQGPIRQEGGRWPHPRTRRCQQADLVCPWLCTQYHGKPS